MPDNSDFQAAIDALWKRLGLEPPRFVQPDRVQLRIEGAALELSDNGRGRIVVEGVAGRLASSREACGRQVRMLLETSLGMLVENEACTWRKLQPNGEAVVAVRSDHDLKSGSLDRLVKKIEDTLQLIEYYGAELKIGASTRSPQAPAAASVEPAVIFRP